MPALPTLALSSVVTANEQHVAAKVMDGEAILINLTTGAYYSIPATGGFIWSVIEANVCLDEIVSTVLAHYDVQREQAEADVLRLCGELHEEGLVIVSDAAGAQSALPPPPKTRLPYSAPTLEKFTDMAEMFALDPPLPGLGAAALGEQSAP